MSNARAIAAVTSMLDYLIRQGTDAGTAIEKVTTRPPDKAREGTDGQLNIFLYQTAVNAAWRNMDLPGHTRPGETGASPLALNLYYLITAYGKDNDDISAHLLLGHAMQMLHDHSTISRADIEAASTTGSLDAVHKSAIAEADLQNQVERLRITPVPLSLDELSRLWSMFQTPYRVSALYEVSVVLIESSRPVKAPLPVLTRGPVVEIEQDGKKRMIETGIVVQPYLMSPYPHLEKVVFPTPQPSLVSGEKLVLEGAQLAQAGGETMLRFSHTHLSGKDELIKVKEPAGMTLEVNIPDVLPAGFYTVTAQVKGEDEAGPGRISNALSFALAPTIDKITVGKTKATLTVTCRPAIEKGQRVSLLLGDRELLPKAPPKDASYPLTSLTFDVTAVEPGDYLVRLRVDGVDSHLIDHSQTPPVFYDVEGVHKVRL